MQHLTVMATCTEGWGKSNPASPPNATTTVTGTATDAVADAVADEETQFAPIGFTPPADPLDPVPSLPTHPENMTSLDCHLLRRPSCQPMSDAVVTNAATSPTQYKATTASNMESFSSSVANQSERSQRVAGDSKLSLLAALVLDIGLLLLLRLFQLLICSFYLLYWAVTSLSAVLLSPLHSSSSSTAAMSPSPNECVVMLQHPVQDDQVRHSAVQTPIQVKIVMTSSDDSSDGEHFYDASSHVQFSDESDVTLNSAKDSGIEADKEVEFVAPDENLSNQIIEQVEFYFSDSHILKDAFLLKHARRNRDGYISLKLITSFKKVCISHPLYLFIHLFIYLFIYS